MLLKHRKQKAILLEIDKGLIGISEILKNIIKMQAISTNGKLKIASQ